MNFVKYIAFLFLFSAFFLGISANSFGQGNLQFNQVKLVGDAPLTVPTEKVWKIESATLSIKDGIRVPPRFVIGTDTIVMGYDSYSTTELENVVSIKLEWKGSNNTGSATCGFPSCSNALASNGSNSVSISLGGIGQGSNILNENLSFTNVPSGSNTNFVNLGIINLSASGNNVLSSWSLSFQPISTQPCLPTSTASFWGINYTFRLTFLMANGNAKSYILTQTGGTCGSSGLITIANPTIATETKSRPQVSTQFPIWVPSGTVVKTLTNIAKLSVLEFNIIP